MCEALRSILSISKTYFLKYSMEWVPSPQAPDGNPRWHYQKVLVEDAFVFFVNLIELLNLIFCTSLQKLLDFLEGGLRTILGLALVHRL